MNGVSPGVSHSRSVRSLVCSSMQTPGEWLSKSSAHAAPVDVLFALLRGTPMSFAARRNTLARSTVP
eukprot:3694366-Prymnesium_polylepis.1